MYTYETAMKNLEYLRQYIGNRSIVIWGSGIAGERFKNAAEELGLKIEFFVDGNTYKCEQLFEGYKVYYHNVLSGKNKDYYVVISSRYYPSIEESIKNYGYEDLIDYRYVYHKYPDPTGNLIISKGIPIGLMP